MFVRLLSVLLVLLVSACAHHQHQHESEIGAMQFPPGEVQHAVIADEIDWKPCPPFVPEGCQMVILEGHPKQPDLFTVRFKLDTTFFMRPHTHPKDERVTILSGKASVAFGMGAKHEDAASFVPGDYYVNKRNEIHTVWIDEPVILQITGIGPWEAHFVEP